MIKPVLARFLILAGLTGLTWSPVALAQLQGTLFSNEEERAYLDVLRRNFLNERLSRGFDIQDAEIIIPELVEESEAAAPTGPVYYTLGGIMSRRDGTRTVWLNNQSLEESRLPSNARVLTVDGIAVLQFSTPNGNIILRPGQTLELNGGTVMANYQRPQNTAPVQAPASASPEGDEENETDAEDPSPVPDTAQPALTGTTANSGDEDILDNAISNLPADIMNNPASIENMINVLSRRADQLEDEQDLQEEADEEAQ